jgi:hypothetical protein
VMRLRGGHVVHIRGVDTRIEERCVELVARSRRCREEGEVAVAKGRVEEGVLALGRRAVGEGLLGSGLGLKLLVEALSRVEGCGVGDPGRLLLLEGVVVVRGEVVRGGSWEGLSSLIQAETKANRGLVRLVGIRRRRVRLFYMRLLMPRRGRAPALALLVHDLCDDAEIESVRGTFQVSLQARWRSTGLC